MPMNETVTMLQAMERMPQPPTSLRDLFFPNTATFDTDKVQMDYTKGGIKLAPFVTDDFGRGVNVAREGYQTTEYKPPMMAPQRPLTRKNLNNIGMGETVYNAKTPEQRAAMVRAKDLIDLRSMSIRREEQMISSFLTHREIIVKGYVDDGQNFVKQMISYPGSGVETLAGSDAWDQPTATIYDDIERARTEVLRSSPTDKLIAVASPNVIQMMRNNEKFLKLLDIRSLSIGNFTPAVTGMPGMDYFGTLGGLNMEIYSYYSQYQDDDGTKKLFLPDDYFVIGVPGRGKRLYGAITQLEPPKTWKTYEGMYIPKYWCDYGGDVEMLRVATRFVPAPEDADDFYTLKVR